MAQFVVVGSLNVDLVVNTAGPLPTPGETVFGKRKETFFGGKGANEAVACARLGGNVRMVGAVGNDEDGSKILETLRDEGVDARSVVRRGDQSGFAAVTVSADGENTVVVVPGANALVQENDVTSDMISEGSLVSCQNEIPLAVTKRAFEVARSKKATTFWNPAPPPAEDVSDILALVDILCVNETEAFAMSKQSSIEKAMTELSKLCPTVIITLGKEGCMYCVKSLGETATIPAYQAGSVVDSTGAGDCFCGSLAYLLCSKIPIRKALELATQVAAVSVTRPGAQSSYPRLSECPPDVKSIIEGRS